MFMLSASCTVSTSIDENESLASLEAQTTVAFESTEVQQSASKTIFATPTKVKNDIEIIQTPSLIATSEVDFSEVGKYLKSSIPTPIPTPTLYQLTDQSREKNTVFFSIEVPVSGPAGSIPLTKSLFTYIDIDNNTSSSQNSSLMDLEFSVSYAKEIFYYFRPLEQSKMFEIETSEDIDLIKRPSDCEKKLVDFVQGTIFYQTNPMCILTSEGKFGFLAHTQTIKKESGTWFFLIEGYVQN